MQDRGYPRIYLFLLLSERLYVVRLRNSKLSSIINCLATVNWCTHESLRKYN